MVRWREKVIRIFPSKDSAGGLVGALPAEKQEEGSTGRRYQKTDTFYDWLDEQADIEATDFQPEPTNRTLQPAQLAAWCTQEIRLELRQRPKRSCARPVDSGDRMHPL